MSNESASSPVRQSVFQRHRKKTLVAILSLMSLLMLIGLELLLGVLHPPPRTPPFRRYVVLREHIPGAHMRFQPTEENQRNSDNLEIRPYAIDVDDNGFIEPSAVHDEPDVSLVFLGGSTTECMFVDPESRFPYVVGRLLEPKHGKVNSYNSGRAGNSSLHSLDILLNKVLPMQPDVVVMMHNVNDLTILMYTSSYWTTELPGRTVIVRRNTKETAKSLLRRLPGALFPNIARWAQPAPTDEFAGMTPKPIVLDPEVLAGELSANLRTFIWICRSRDILPVLMTQENRLVERPDESVSHSVSKLQRNYGISYADYRATYLAMNQAIRDVGAEERVMVIDLAAVVPQTAEYIADACHFNEHGSRFAAKIIAGELTKVLPER